MGSLAGKKSLVERRLKELKKESELVREDIKVLAKVVNNPKDANGIPRLKSLRFDERRVPPPTRKDPVAASREPSQPVQKPAGPGGELFDWAPQAEKMDRQAAGQPPKVIGPSLPEPVGDPKNKAMAKDERFVNYFSSGNFLGVRPMRKEKNVQRNKAVFMVVVVIIVAFSVIRLVFK